MKVTSYYPVIMTERVEETAAFYIAHFGFRENFASNWYVHLQSAEDSSINLAILDGRHETIPPQGRGRSMTVFGKPDCRFCLPSATKISVSGIS
jgi:hypothetical protein